MCGGILPARGGSGQRAAENSVGGQPGDPLRLEAELRQHLGVVLAEQRCPPYEAARRPLELCEAADARQRAELGVLDLLEEAVGEV